MNRGHCICEDYTAENWGCDERFMPERDSRGSQNLDRGELRNRGCAGRRD